MPEDPDIRCERTMTDTPERFDSKRRTPVDHPHTLEALPSDADAPAEYTFVPRGAEDDRLTEWMTVDRDAVVDLGAWR